MSSGMEGPHEVFVKNTFLDLQDEAPLKPRRRCNSQPPPSVHRDSAAPTVAPNMSNGQPPEAEFKKKAHPTAYDTEMSTDDCGGPDVDTASSDDTSSSSWPSIPAHSQQPPPPPKAAPAVSRSPLSSKARAWQPPVGRNSNSSMAAAPGETPQRPQVRGLEYAFGQEAARLATSTKTELMAYVRKVDVEAGAHGWAIFIWTKLDDADDNLALLNIAKNMILQGAAKSKIAYVLGSDKQPIIPQPHGFMVTLCAMHDKAKACLDTYQQGFCPYKPFCKKVHPKVLVPLHVIVHRESGSGSAADRERVKKQFLGARNKTSSEHMDMVEKLYMSMMTERKPAQESGRPCAAHARSALSS